MRGGSVCTDSALRRTSWRRCARQEGRDCYAFVRPSDVEAARFALELGCVWARSSDERPPVELDAAIVFAPVGALVPVALAAVRPGGVCRLRRHSHERHPVVPVRAAVGRARTALGREPHSQGRSRVHGACEPHAAADPVRPIRARQANDGSSPSCATAACAVPRCSCPESRQHVQSAGRARGTSGGMHEDPGGARAQQQGRGRLQGLHGSEESAVDLRPHGCPGATRAARKAAHRT